MKQFWLQKLEDSVKEMLVNQSIIPFF